MPTLRYHAGFQQTADRWLTYPYVLIQHHAVNSATFGEIARALSNVKGRTLEDFGKQNLVSNARFGEFRSDPERLLVFMPMSMDVAGAGPVRGLSAMKPGRIGLVQLTFYAPAAGFDVHSRAFNVLLDSLNFSPGYEYSAAGATLRKLDWDQIAARALVGAIIGGIVGFVGYLRRRTRGKTA
jgi:hypothetical protein